MKMGWHNKKENSMNMTKFFPKIGALILGLCFATSLFAAQTYEPQLEHQRNPNDYCVKCHKFSGDGTQHGGQWHLGKFYGIHLTKMNPNNGKPITCVSCHGNISENHRRGAKDVMRFQSDIFSKTKPMYTVEQQNQVCFACHNPDKMREKLWVHDVHAMKLPCAACHVLHPKDDPMHGLNQKEQVKLCVDCHGKQQREHTNIQHAQMPHIDTKELKNE
ncbi:cytochrome c nitrite reductase pentaheme subunit [Actinobacillus delphinicola]